MKVGGAGIEPATPGFSIVVSDDPESGASVDSVNGSTMRTSELEISAQQIAQHERSVGAGDVESSYVRELSGNDPALRLLVEVWNDLPDSAKRQILNVAASSVVVE